MKKIHLLARKRFKTKYTGVYFRYLTRSVCSDGKPDKCYDISYRDASGKLFLEKAGRRSEGCTIQDAVELREKRIQASIRTESDDFSLLTGKRIKTQYTGIYFRDGNGRICEDGKPDICYDIRFRDASGKFVFEEAGRRSEGYTVEDAVELREKRIHGIIRPESDATALLQTGKRIKTQYTGVYFRHGKGRMCQDGKPDKCYDITYQDADGKFVFEKVGWRSEGYTVQDAVDLRGKRVRKNRHPELFGAAAPPVPSGITVDEAWALFKKNWLPNLKDQYVVTKVYERHIQPRFGHQYILALSVLDIEKFKQDLLTTGGKQGMGLKAATVSKILSNFKRIVSKAFKWGLVEGKNPLAGVTVKNAFAKRERYLTQKEAEQILDGLGLTSCNLYHVARIALYTGLRLSEILNLRGNDINIPQGVMRVRDGKAGERTAYLPKKFAKELKKLIPADNTAFLFTGRRGQKLSAHVVSDSFAKFMDQTGFNGSTVDSEHKIVFHTFRHTFCSWLAIAGVPLFTIAKLAGHKTIRMTERYAKLSPTTQRNALDHLPVIK
ncbi:MULTISPECIES: tyrosine-type recombinase/integrase [Desulfovibrio]|uniref:Site-specific recombinase XerD n=1 Tax=Desulfovibrio desulfuricans TaxID=876 RepID=A0AA94HTQ3_DESDE|nr:MULTISPECIES: site-specific integrase [Desulfovibrio]ATD82369.1 site-specific integrase [Desulfovibrio sp. G11]SFW59041.1 Site-specific recombinase XerD [Desulfovibrio desulfuricans]SPD35148.1 Integrase [Desulfovibrio sp. G11]